MARQMRLPFLIFVAVALFSTIAKSADADQYGSVQIQFKTLPLITLSVTPNYQSGYGPQGGVGSGSTPAPGSNASLGGGDVDFGNQVVQGYAYLYKYAVKATVMTNDSSGFNVYAEGGTDINDLSAGGTVPLNQTLYWLDSSSSNTPFSAATPFSPTSSPVGCGGTCINYAGSPPASAAVWNYPTETIGQPGNTVSQGFDYQLRLYNTPATSTDSYTVYIIYTAVGN
jgi:hypothetical protein